LETERLVLRELILEDAPAIFQNYSDAEATEFIMEPLTSLEQAQNLVQEFIDEYKQGERVFWAVVLKENNAFLGTCSYEGFHWEDFRAEIGYDLTKGYWGRGFMTEAVQAVIRYGFESLGLNRIEASTFPQNNRSISLLRRLHFQHEGTFRQNSWFKVKFWDEVFFALLKEDWVKQ
jgi:ribosomal-protein-alanine N-acetyltransferase